MSEEPIAKIKSIPTFQESKNINPNLKKGHKELLFLDPRPIRHHERISDLFYLLFRRDKS